MKNKLLLSIAFLFLTKPIFAQYIFGVSPGLSFNSAYFGYKINKKLVIYGGLQFATVSFKFTESGIREGSVGLESYSEKSEFKGGGFVPNIGVKHYFKQKNKIRPYTTINLAKPIVKAKLSSDDEVIDKEVNDAIKNIKFWAGEWGFGTEYFFDDNFSIGGEFGIRKINIKAKLDRTESVFDPSAGNNVDVEIKSEAKTGINPTYTRFSLNFYF